MFHPSTLPAGGEPVASNDVPVPPSASSGPSSSRDRAHRAACLDRRRWTERRPQRFLDSATLAWVPSASDVSVQFPDLRSLAGTLRRRRGIVIGAVAGLPGRGSVPRRSDPLTRPPQRTRPRRRPGDHVRRAVRDAGIERHPRVAHADHRRRPHRIRGASRRVTDRRGRPVGAHLHRSGRGDGFHPRVPGRRDERGGNSTYRRCRWTPRCPCLPGRPPSRGLQGEAEGALRPVDQFGVRHREPRTRQARSGPMVVRVDLHR